MSNTTKDTTTTEMNNTHTTESLTTKELEELLNSKELRDDVKNGNDNTTNLLDAAWKYKSNVNFLGYRILNKIKKIFNKNDN